MDQLHTRFDPRRYQTDEPVIVGAAGQEHEVPERLFTRAQAIASAYELHLLPAIDLYTRTELNRAQCETLADEVAFVEQVSNDPLLAGHLATLLAFAERCARQGPQATLVIKGP